MRTIQAWVTLFDENHQDQLPKFKLELILDDDDHMQFYPVLSDVEAAVFHVVDTVANTMQNVPTVQVIKHCICSPRASGENATLLSFLGYLAFALGCHTQMSH